MKRILLIDDDSAIHLIASAALQGVGAFKIGFARSGTKGLERARATRPDVILLDSMMPDLDGEEVLERLRRDADLRDTPVIFLTARGDDPGFDYEALGAQGVISKPFDPDDLAGQIREVLDLPEEPTPANGNGSGNGSGRPPAEPAFPAGGSVDELRRSFVERGRKEVARVAESLGPSFDADAARRLAHLWVGRGGTLGHPQISVVARRLELRLAEGWDPDKKWRVQSDLRDVAQAFESAWRDEQRRDRRETLDLEEGAGDGLSGEQPEVIAAETAVVEIDAGDIGDDLPDFKMHLPPVPEGGSDDEDEGPWRIAGSEPEPTRRDDGGDGSAAEQQTPETASDPEGSHEPADDYEAHEVEHLTADLGQDAATVVEAALPAELPSEFVEALSGRTVGLFGFDECDTEAMREVFAATETTIKASGLGLRIESRDEIPDIDAVVVNVSVESDAGWEQVDTFAAAGLGCLAVGTGRQLLSGADHAGRCEFLLAPWCAEEVLLRCYQLISVPPGAADAPGSAAIDSGTADEEYSEVEINSDVVIADDDPTINALVEMTLREAGLNCHVATGGEDALELIREVRPRAAVLDVNMPQMDGFEVLAAIRNDPDVKATPVVMLTALRQEADVIRGFRLGADDYVVKPFNPMELSARLERLIRASG